MMKPNFVHRGILSILFIFLITDVLAKEPAKKAVVQELTARKGLPDFFVKVRQGDTIRVAYLGGSITAQQGWRVYSLEWMKERFPQSEFIEINAAIGGTGSDFGVFRLNEHVAVFRLLSEPFDKAAILKRRGNVMKAPADYKKNNWYLGKIMLDGILL